MGVLRYTIRRGSETVASRSIAGSSIRIGRAGDLRLEDPGISRLHAVVEFSGDGITVADLGSASGTFLNGRLVDRARVSKGDVIGVGETSLLIDGFDATPSPAARTGAGGSSVRYCSLRILDKCPHCGAGLPVNGLLDTVLCGNCQKETNLRAGYWKAVLEDPDNDYATGGGSYSLNFETDVRWKAERPACAKCGHELPVNDVPPGSMEDVACPSCGHGNSTYPAPEWLGDALPSARQVYCGERPAGEGTGELEVDDGAKPVILSCPQCKGALKVTSRSDRLVPCEYCGSDVYLPNDLWKRLHPVKTSSTWYIRYEGKSQDRIESERERAQEQERWHREEEAFQEKERIRKKLKPAHIGWTLFAAVIATVVIGPLLPLLSGGGDPLFGIAGKLLCPGACEGCEGPMRTETWTTQTSDGTSTQFDFYCAPPGAAEEQWVRVADGTLFVTTVVVLFPVLLLISGIVLVFIRLSRR